MNIYMVYGTLMGKVKPSMAWQVCSIFPIEIFIEKFKDLAPEYDISVWEDTLYNMQIINTIELTG